MFEIFKPKGVIPFLRHAKPVATISIILMLAAFLSLMTRGINWGLDFTGGYVVEVTFEQGIETNTLREAVAEQGIEGAIVQHFGSARDLLIRIPPAEGETQELVAKVELASAELVDQYEVKRVEFVGPQVGQELAEQGGLAVLAAIFCILAYVAARFEWRLALGAVAALIHDVVITLGVFSILQLEFDLTVLAALLAVVGYSLNDTIVVFDRVRENFRRMRKGDTELVINTSVTQTMSRTIITTGTTLFVVVSLFIVGGSMIHGFATALLIGIAVGTYSSIYVASYTSVHLGLTREHMLPVEIEKEGADQDTLAP